MNSGAPTDSPRSSRLQRHLRHPAALRSTFCPPSHRLRVLQWPVSPLIVDELPARLGGREAGVKVMIVEDSPLVRKMYGLALSPREHQLTAAEDGRRALEILADPAQSFDLILLDLRMPDMNGVDFIRGCAAALGSARCRWCSPRPSRTTPRCWRGHGARRGRRGEEAVDAAAPQARRQQIVDPPHRGVTMAHSFLVIDDSKLHHQMYRLIFSRGSLAGSTLYPPPTGAKATRLLPPHPELTLVLLDLNMPEMNGLEVLEPAGARSGLHPHVPIVLVTTEGTAEDEARGRAAGAWDYLRKPFQPADVERLVERALAEAAGECRVTMSAERQSLRGAAARLRRSSACRSPSRSATRSWSWSGGGARRIAADDLLGPLNGRLHTVKGNSAMMGLAPDAGGRPTRWKMPAACSRERPGRRNDAAAALLVAGGGLLADLVRHASPELDPRPRTATSSGCVNGWRRMALRRRTRSPSGGSPIGVAAATPRRRGEGRERGAGGLPPARRHARGARRRTHPALRPRRGATASWPGAAAPARRWTGWTRRWSRCRRRSSGSSPR